MTDAWPITLPQNFDIPGFAEGMGDDLLETNPDVGPPITRLRSTSGVRPIGGQMTITEDQLTIFKSFFNITISRGALPFSFPQQISPAINMLVKFPKGSMPSWTPLGGGYWRLSLRWIILP